MLVWAVGDPSAGRGELWVLCGGFDFLGLIARVAFEETADAGRPREKSKSKTNLFNKKIESFLFSQTLKNIGFTFTFPAEGWIS